MRHLRATSRLVPLVVYTTACFLTCALARGVEKVIPSVGERMRLAVVQAWGRGVSRIVGLQLTFEGPPPEPPFLLVSNHLSYLDIIVYASLLRCAFVSKAEVRQWPLMGPAAAVANTVFVPRTQRRRLPEVVEAMRAAIPARGGLLFFPEGTSTAGSDVLPFRPALFQAAARLDTPVRCASVTYRAGGGAPTGRVVCWWGDMPFGSHVYRLLQLPRIDAHVVFHAEHFESSDRKELARVTHEVVASGFQAVPSDPPRKEATA